MTTGLLPIGADIAATVLLLLLCDVDVLLSSEIVLFFFCGSYFNLPFFLGFCFYIKVLVIWMLLLLL